MKSLHSFVLCSFALAELSFHLAVGPCSAQVYEKLYSFTDARAAEINALATKGSDPRAGLVQGNDGNFYGTTAAGGASGQGSIFRMTAAGVLTTLVEFSGNGSGNKGATPLGDLLRGSDGNFYGTTSSGGGFGLGTVFKMTPNGTLTTLVEFTGDGASNKGSSPAASVMQGNDGYLYGTTRTGGAANLGTIFKLHPAGQLTTLVEFTGNGASNKGSEPEAKLMLATDGSLYGTTRKGGAADFGTIFKLTGSALTTLVEFTGNGTTNKGSLPHAGLVQGSDGSFYGTTSQGGATNDGTAFKMTASGNLTTLVEFNGTGSSGSLGTAQTFNNSAPITINDNASATPYPSTINVPGGIGNIGKTRVILRQLSHTFPADTRFLLVSPTGTTCLLMSGVGGGTDVSNLTLTLDDDAASLVPSPIISGTYRPSPNGAQTAAMNSPAPAAPYGTQLSVFNGESAVGTWSLYVLDRALTDFGSLAGGWSLELTPQLPGIAGNGRHPMADLLEGSDGSFYGTTQYGGQSDNGTAFKLTPAGVLTTLVEFTSNGVTNKGSLPRAALVQTSDGNFFGTSSGGGRSGNGTVFKITSGGVLTTLVEFAGSGRSNKSILPSAVLVQGNDGSFYGTTQYGGAFDLGTVFRVTPAGVLTTLVEFTGDGASNKGSKPTAGLVQGSDGDFYGTTIWGGASDLGTIFKMTPNGVLTTLVEFTGTSDGNQPFGGLVEGSDGYFYGTTQSGVSASGTIFKMTPSGVLTTLVQFTGNGASNKGSVPYAALVEGSDGNFYGTTLFGGASDYGTVFKMTPAGVLTTLVQFTRNGASNKGSYPSASLVQGNDGNFYGRTSSGGVFDKGTVFKMTPAGVLTTLVEFNTGGSNNGFFYSPGLLQGSDGNFYGTTFNGGASGDGTVFKMTPGGVLTTLVDFTGNGESNKGSEPFTGLVQGRDGNFYGTTETGGASDYGTVFKITPGGVLTTLAEFIGAGMERDAGSSPLAGLVQGSDGNFYGTTESGGGSGFGTVFKMTSGGVLTTLVEFTGNGMTNKGRSPRAGLVQGSDGNLYGTTSNGGASDYGTVFKMTPGGTLTTLVEFTGGFGSTLGANPFAGLVQGSNGNFYGTTRKGGSYHGTVFMMTADGLLTTLVSFPFHEKFPEAGLLQGSDGNFYGTVSGFSSEGGNVFKVTPSGVLTTLVQFTGNGPSNKGFRPLAGLAHGSDGNFYGTTREGGASGNGTVFKMTPAGALTTLVEFTGTSGNNKGAYPVAGLVQGNDGNFYGTTSNGGAFNYGTIFKMTSSGLLTTLVEFAASEEGNPAAALVRGTDGNLYGTTGGPDGSIYRLVFPGAPLAVVSNAELQGSTSAIIEAQVNARGASTTVSLEYGTDGVSFPNTIPIAVNLTGYQSKLVGTILNGLAPGTTYYFRFRGVSGAGTTVTAVQSISTLAEPLVATSPASSILPTSAHLNGTVNARNFDTTVAFEWGTDGNSFPNSMSAMPGTVTGNTLVNVSMPVAGLTKGTMYHYRLVATNAGGTTVSGTQSFRTLTEPTASTSGSFALSTTSVRVEGWVNAQGSDSTVAFEYGTDGINFPNSVAATPGTVTGNGNTPVSAILTTLAQGNTYHYRIRATSDGGIGTSPTATFSMNVLSGFEQVTPGAPPESGGFLTVNLSPPGLLHGWRFVGETDWRDPRIQARGLVTGRYEIEFRPVPGYITPFPLRGNHAVEIQSGSAPTVVEAFYYTTGAAGAGGLSVTLKPDSITTGEGRAQWRLLGESEEDWRDSGTTVSGLVPGNYLVELKPVTNRTTPSHVSVPVVEGQTTAPTVTYFSSGETTGTAPVPLAFETIAATEDNPFAFVGQIRSRSGLGTGFAVKPRVVATAAHVVWDEGTLSGAEGLQWIHRQHRGVHEPPPHVPRGFFILTGYDEARTLENSPGSFSPQSRNRDIAALYFTDRDAAQGGYGGFLASDLEANEFLLSNANKRFAAYPIDGIANLSRGLMHATTPFNIGFSPVSFTPLATGQPPLPEGRRLFFTTDIRSSGGASGGPLFVQFEGGAYYPAAVYLGGTSQMIVRAIDSAAVELFNRAAESSIEDNGNTGGGITHSGVTPIGGADTAAALKVNLAPAGAVAAGARWRLGPDAPWRSSGEQAGGLSNARYILEFSAVPGYQLPAPQTVQVKGGQLKTVTFSYALLPVPAAAITLRGNGRSIGNGDTSPSPLDGSDFGVVAVDGGTATRTFSISNPGTSELSVGSLMMDGMNEDDFSISIPPGSAIPPGGSTTFSILFVPSDAGTRSATVSFATNVTGSNPFTFAIQGNDSTDSDSNGFTDVEEAALAELIASFTVGETIDLDLSFLRLGAGQVLALLNLPPGLSFDPGTNRITGTITGKAANPQIEIRKVDGANIISSVTTDFPVVIPARVTVSGAHPFPATRIGRRSRPQTLIVTNSGELALGVLTARSIGKAARDFVLTQPRTKTLDAGGTTTVTVTFKPRAKGIRRAGITIFSNTPPKTVPVSGRGK